MADRSQADEVWEHGKTSILNLFASIASARRRVVCHTFQAALDRPGNKVKHCSCVPPDVHDYFQRDLNQTANRKKTKNKERLLREEVAAKGNVLYDIDSDDEELQRALHTSREEAHRERVARQRGGQYEHDGGSSQQ
jgi:hypothetical protein